MKNPLNRDEFENYLEQQVSQHRMYPSDHVWRSIQQDLHGHKKWPALTIITLFVISALVVGTVLIRPQHQSITYAANGSAKKPSENIEPVSKQPQENLEEHLSPQHITQQTIADVTKNIDIDNAIPNAFADYDNIPELLPAENSIVNPAIAVNTTSAPFNAAALTTPALDQKKISKRASTPDVAKNNINWMMVTMPDESQALNGPLLHFSMLPKTTHKNNFMFSLGGSPSFTPKGLNIETTVAQEPGITAFKFKPRSDKFDFQFFATPSISYRRLVDNVHGSTSNNYVPGIPYGANYKVDLSRSARHKPAAGYEAGATIGYKLNDRLTLRSGFQFDMRQYDVVAYKSSPDITNTPTSNNSFTGGGGSVPQNINAPHPAAIAPVNDAIVLRNRYYEMSMPIGVDWKAWSSGRLSWGLATAIQPTYIFNREPFSIISSDTKNSLVDGSKLLRQWNINTNFETYLGYTTGEFRWQIGPQFRYQVLPTLAGNYPIKEHLLDYGIKIGFVKSLP